MRQMKKMIATVAEVLLLGGVAFSQGVSTTAPAPNRNITAPGPQRQQPGGGQHPSTTNLGIANAATPPLVHMVGQGVITGYVYWDTKSVTHIPPANCNGLGAAVSVGTPQKGQPTFEQFKLLGTFHNFTYIGNAGSYAICQYVVKQLPVGQDLEVMVNSKQPSFTPSVMAAVPPTANNPNHPINIGGGSCNKLPPAVPSASVLGSGWWTCGNDAYNVNFVIQPATAANMGSGGLHLTPAPGTLQGAMSQGTQGGMLAGGNTQGGMLNGGTNPGPQNPLGGSLKGGRAPGPIGTSTGGALPGGGGGAVQLNPQPFPPKATTSMPGSNANNVQLNPQPYPPKGTSSVGGGNGSNVSLNPQPYPPKGISSGGGANGSKVSLNPQPLPPRSIRSQAVKLSAPHQGQKITNPKAAAHNAAIIAVLAKQRHVADAEAAQMKLSIAPAAIQTQPSTVMSATGNGGMIAPSGNAQRVSTTANIPPATTSSSSVSRYGKLSPGMIPGLALQCAHNPSMRISTVSGGPQPAIFTPDPQYDFYTITGCSFGNAGPNAKVYIYYQGTFHEDFIIDEWTDNWIKLHLDTTLTGVDDQKNLTLVIQRADGQQTSKSGYQFYAVRATTLLSGIPQSDFSLNSFRPDQSVLKAWKPTYTSGSSASVIPNLPGLSAEVHWDITPDPNGTVVGGADDYDFSHLHSSFVPESAWMEWTDLSCGQDEQFAASTTTWGLSWYGSSGLQVSWQGQMCQNKWHTCGGAFQPDCFYSPPESNYGIDVWVTGPRGLDPWTGKPGS